IILYGAPSDKIFATIDEKPVILAIKDYLEFGKTYIDINYFRVGSNSFYESLNYNYGLNQKLFIDSLGDIFLSFGFPIKIGNLFNDKIEEILSNEKVKEFWKVTKDDVFICDNCEYRYMCFDEGELVRINAKYKKKVECPYNPFISKWDYQEGYMNLNECGIYIQNDKLVIDENRLNHINEELYT
ncbi:MAG: SPASM domain-containing protein, partial [Saprospiraceae bacterium]